MKSTYFKVCPRCGAHLDPGETCDCGHNDQIATKGGKDHAED